MPGGRCQVPGGRCQEAGGRCQWPGASGPLTVRATGSSDDRRLRQPWRCPCCKALPNNSQPPFQLFNYVVDYQLRTYATCQVPVPGARCQVPGARCQVPGARCQVPGARCQVPGARCQVPGARCQVPGARCQVPGARCQVPGARCQDRQVTTQLKDTENPSAPPATTDT